MIIPLVSTTLPPTPAATHKPKAVIPNAHPWHTTHFCHVSSCLDVLMPAQDHDLAVLRIWQPFLYYLNEGLLLMDTSAKRKVFRGISVSLDEEVPTPPSHLWGSNLWRSVDPTPPTSHEGLGSNNKSLGSL